MIEMTHPTNNELEAMAKFVEHKGVLLLSMANDISAKLRACKTGDSPDHAEWNAAIEAAVNEIDCGCDGLCLSPHACPKDDVQSIRQLKKGQTND
jgi:hypothetical protein